MTQAPPKTPTERWSGAPNWVLHQVGWWACVLWMGWKGPLVMAFFLATHLVMLRRELRVEITLMAVATAIGIALDSTLSIAGAVQYEGTLLIGQAPLWLVAIWAGFGATLRHSQSIFVRSKLTAGLTGFVGGPLAYLGGEKLGRLVVHDTFGMLSVSALWAVAMFTLFWTVHRLSENESPNP